MMNKITEKLMYELVSSLLGHVRTDNCMNLIDKTGNPIILCNGDVNWTDWHEGSLKHDYFKFSTYGRVCIETEEQAEEFKNIVLRYYRGCDCTPSLSEYVKIFIEVDGSPVDKQLNDYFEKNNDITIKHIIFFTCGHSRDVGCL